MMPKKNNENKEFSFLEPYGHTSPKSQFERYWERFKGPFSLFRERITQYSAYDGMTHYPLRYKIRRFNLPHTEPPTEWIIETFKDFVKTEFSERSKPKKDFPNRWPIKIDDTVKLPVQFLEKFLLASEWQGRIDIREPSLDSPEDIADCIYELLCNPKIGSSKNSENNNREEFIRRIIPTIKEKSRLLFVLPGFPFKDQNRFRVPFGGGIPDLGEISFVIRLFNITQTMYQVHPYGVDVVVLSDGELYRKIFDILENDVISYMNNVIAYRNKLNLQGAISFLCLKELINRSSDDSRAWKIAESIRKSLCRLLKSDSSGIAEMFQLLVSGMKWNYNTNNNDYLSDVNDEECWQIIRMEEAEVRSRTKKLWKLINDKAINAALEYASINLMLRWTDLIHCFFPDAIRGTVHPKPGQFALAGSGISFVWNGVAASKNWPTNIDDIRIMPYMSLNEFKIVRKAVLEDTELPLFFTQGTPNKNIDSAKSVLSHEGWTLGKIHGRELKQSDLTEFINLGISDKYFSWERTDQTADYFTGLFQYRVSHYSRYGFGIHGLWVHDKLIGQCGLQVLDEDQDELEVVIFLGKDYTHKGLGSQLFQYVLDRCLDSGITCLYGIVRPDNHEAIKLLEKFNSERKRTVRHFNQEGILYQIKCWRK